MTQRFSLLLTIAVLTTFFQICSEKTLHAAPLGPQAVARPASTFTPVNADRPTVALEKKARAFIDSVAARGIGFLSTDKNNLDAQKQLFRDLLRDSFDLHTIGRFALGKYWRASTPAQRAEYQDLFEKMVIDTYAARFATYKGQALNITTAQIVDGGDILVGSQIVPPDGAEKINVDWRVRITGPSMKIVDIVVEGVSMAITQRSDFSGLIGQKNGDITTLIDHLKNRKTNVGS